MVTLAKGGFLLAGRAARVPGAVLWDMDGTLVDSTEYHYLAWRETLSRRGGKEISREEFLATFGQRNDVVVRGFLGQGVPEQEVATIAQEKEARYRELVRQRGIALLPGVARWLERLSERGFAQALASSAPRANVEAVLAATGIGHYFAAIVAGEDVQHGKPHPEVFLLAAQRLGVPPERCVVVEDAPPGLEAARRAGMRSIGVCSNRAGLQADIVVGSLEELPEDVFEQLLGRG